MEKAQCVAETIYPFESVQFRTYLTKKQISLLQIFWQFTYGVIFVATLVKSEGSRLQVLDEEQVSDVSSVCLSSSAIEVQAVSCFESSGCLPLPEAGTLVHKDVWPSALCLTASDECCFKLTVIRA